MSREHELVRWCDAAVLTTSLVVVSKEKERGLLRWYLIRGLVCPGRQAGDLALWPSV